MLEQELSFANEVADLAAEIALPLFRAGPEVRLKSDHTPVTQADIEIEEMVRRAVAERFPADAVLGEEQGGELAAGRLWIVDPIDGTKNFASGIQVWGTLLALADEGRPVLGLASAPALGERYEAVRGEGATRGGSLIRVSDRGGLEQAVVCQYATEDWLGGPNEQGLLSVLGGASRSVGFTDFWGHCLVARGAVDVMLEPTLRVWDWAALKVIVEEAGGRMTGFDGGEVADGSSVLTTNAHLHDEVLGLLASG